MRLQLITNHGAAFGLAAGYEPLLAVAALPGVLLLGLWAGLDDALREQVRAQRAGRRYAPPTPSPGAAGAGMTPR